MAWLEGLFIALLFAAGLRLSAFFSGTETGFYRMSLPRLTIDAQAGDVRSQRLLWFARNPSAFVATTLVGNNLANYFTTLAISLGVVYLAGDVSDTVEVGATVVLSPLVFLLGELLPKSLYYRAPLTLMKRDVPLFSLFYRVLLPASWPLVGVTKFIERIAPEAGRRTELLLGRSHLVQLMTQGRREGVLTDVQNRLANGVLQIAPQPVVASITPANRVLGLDERATRQQVLDYARRFATPAVAIRHADSEEGWFAYVRVVDVALDKKPVASMFRTMPVIAPSASKLDALQLLQTEGEAFGVVMDGERVLGIVSSRGLCEQLFRPVTPLRPRGR